MPKGKPNILIIWGDDIGWFNISAYNHGVMGYRTPNIDRIGAWEEPFVRTRVPQFFNLRANPFEIDDEDANLFFNKEKADRLFLILPAVGLVSQYLKTFEEFPPRQRPASFSIDQALEQAREHEQALHEAATRG